MIEVPGDTGLGKIIHQAQQALSMQDWVAAATSYDQALGLMQLEGNGADLRRALWTEHVGTLLTSGQLTSATEVARRYIAAATRVGDEVGQLDLGILLAEALAAQGNWRETEELVELCARLFSAHVHPAQARPALIRLQGLLAAERGAMEEARELLLAAQQGFLAEGHQTGASVVQGDLRRLALAAGDPTALDEILTEVGTGSVPEVLLQARALRRDARYETAARCLERLLSLDVEPSLRFSLLHELTVLYLILGRRDTAESMLPLLDEAAVWVADPSEARESVRLLRAWGGGSYDAMTSSAAIDMQIQSARLHTARNEFDEAEAALRKVRPEANQPRLAALWSLAAGELEFGIGVHTSDERTAMHHGEQAIGHLTRAAGLAREISLPEVYTESVRLTGRVYEALLDNVGSAVEWWARARQGQELIAHRQETDATRIRYLESLPTEHDELVEATASRVSSGDATSAAGVAVAIEAARGATVLAMILPREAARFRDLPLPNSPKECWQWYQRTVGHLPRSQAIWLLHATPDRLHHCLMARDMLHYAGFPTDRHELHELIDRLRDSWLSPETLESTVREDPKYFSGILSKVADHLHLDGVLKSLTANVTRLAIVAGDALADIPFAALPVRSVGGREALTARYAISDLPCVSAYAPLARRSRANRGDAGLMVDPRASEITTANASSDYFRLEGKSATIAGLHDRLRSRKPRILLLETHGTHVSADGAESWMELMPDGTSSGHLTAREFHTFDLKSCGTVVLGACETGMSVRLGRDERVGFVRAGLTAGAAAIVAARWVAVDAAAAAILDRFHFNLRYLPRDVALQRAQLWFVNHYAGNRDLPNPAHPARWACWTLYGDAGWQTNAGRLRRLVRRYLATWRDHDAR